MCLCVARSFIIRLPLSPSPNFINLIPQTHKKKPDGDVRKKFGICCNSLKTYFVATFKQIKFSIYEISKTLERRWNNFRTQCLKNPFWSSFLWVARSHEVYNVCQRHLPPSNHRKSLEPPSCHKHTQAHRQKHNHTHKDIETQRHTDKNARRGRSVQ